MAQELNVQQAREILRLRWRHPGAEVRVHHKPWGVIVEVRSSGHAVELKRFDWTGAVMRDRQVAFAA